VPPEIENYRHTRREQRPSFKHDGQRRLLLPVLAITVASAVMVIASRNPVHRCCSYPAFVNAAGFPVMGEFLR
jgi:hypothetical protein